MSARMGRTLRRLALAAAATLALGAPGVGAQAACRSPGFCAEGGPCIDVASVRAQVRQAYGIGEGSRWKIARIRLASGAPTPTCLWYEVWMTGPGGGAKIAYWSIYGGQVR